MVLKNTKYNSEKKEVHKSKNLVLKHKLHPHASQAYYDLFFISILLLIDRLTKIFALKLKEPIDYIIVELTYIKNTGAGFSTFNNMNIFLAILASIIGIILIYFYISGQTHLKKNIKHNQYYVPRFSFITIISGTIGNVIDRMFNGGVIDFINFKIFPVFNFSDIIIFLGVCYWIIIFYKTE